MPNGVYFLGGAQTDFARNIAREGRELVDFTVYAALDAIDDAKLEPADIESIHVGNAFGELFTGQAQMGALLATSIPIFRGVPAARHEGACASGSLAILAAAAEIEAGRYDCVLVVGAEQEKNVPGEMAARHMGTAAWTGHEAKDARYVWPHVFHRITEAIDQRKPGTASRAHLAAIAKKNFANARANPNAQTRGWAFGETAFDDDDEANPIVEGRVRRQDCGQVTDGAAAIVLASESFVKKTGRVLSTLPRICGWGHRTGSLSLDHKITASKNEPYLIPHMRQAVLDAYRRANVEGPFALDGIETHDCFTVTELLALDHLGITPPGEAHRAIEERLTEKSGRIPVNPSGGLIGLGHPVGATGVRMALDACRQVTGRAGDMQVRSERRRFGTLNIGGSATTVVTFVWGTEES